MLPVLAEEPRSCTKEKEITSPKLTTQGGGRDSQPEPDEGCAEGATAEQATTVGSDGLEIGATGAGPSLPLGPVQPKQVS
jgi:hypothetical protein